MGKRDKKQSSPEERCAAPRPRAWNSWLLGLALLASVCIYWPVLGANWFYDDSDYVLNDPRLNHLELFLPSQCASPPVLKEGAGPDATYLPGYHQPLISDRYLWRLSFALERRIFALSPAVSHTINLLLHLATIVALNFALSRLVEMYLSENRPSGASVPPQSAWRMLPGLAALCFAVHPWASEPVCYVSARDGSMGAVFVLLGVGFWAHALGDSISRWRRIVDILVALLLAMAAYASKENFIVAPAVYVLAIWPLFWRRHWTRSHGFSIAAAAGTLVLLVACAWLGIHASERARGLFAQAVGGRGANYFFEIQSPLLLKTLADQIPASRLALETNHPEWSVAACWIALAFNAGLAMVSTLGAIRWPPLLALSGFYLTLLPTNSILPRPDFLAMRNVYLPAACIATLFAGVFLYLINKSAGPGNPAKRRAFISVLGATMLIYWAASTFLWARGFAQPEMVWRKSSAVAPDHAAVRLNLAAAILTRNAPLPPDRAQQAEAELEINAALKAEDSPTMAWQTPRPRAVRRALALRMLGNLRLLNGQMAEAEAFFRRSFAEQPLVVIWAAWAETAFSQGWREKVAEILAQGENRWPGAWWTCALRGLHHASAQSPETLHADVLRDLTAAEAAPDALQPELRSLQARALFTLAQTPAVLPRIESLVDRLKRMGVSPQDLKRLSAKLDGKNSKE